VRNWISPASAGTNEGEQHMSSSLLTTTPAIPAPPSPNTVLSDLVDAVETYPQQHLTVEIYDVDPPGPETGINEHEDVTFKVHVRNSGPLEILGLTLLIEAEAGADGVKLHGGAAFNPSLTSTPIDVLRAHMADDEWVDPPDGHFHFLAGPPSGGKVDLVKASVDAWDGSLRHILEGHSEADPAVQDTLAKNVLKG
jgi:hypothetical protein